MFSTFRLKNISHHKNWYMVFFLMCGILKCVISSKDRDHTLLILPLELSLISLLQGTFYFPKLVFWTRANFFPNTSLPETLRILWTNNWRFGNLSGHLGSILSYFFDGLLCLPSFSVASRWSPPVVSSQLSLRIPATLRIAWCRAESACIYSACSDVYCTRNSQSIL